MSNDTTMSEVRRQVTAEEWQTRIELAAAYRLVAHFGWDDLIFTHISARVPGPEHHFLINPYGLMFEEITASSLVKIGLDGRAVEDSPHLVNPAGFVIHSALHAARADAQCVLHTHTRAGCAVAALACGLLPVNQISMEFSGRDAYHDYEGIAHDLTERERLVRDLGTGTGARWIKQDRVEAVQLLGLERGTEQIAVERQHPAPAHRPRRFAREVRRALRDIRRAEFEMVCR